MGHGDNQWRDNERRNWRDDGSQARWREDEPEDRRWEHEGDNKRRRTDYHDAKDDRTRGGETHSWDHGGYYEEYATEEHSGGGNGGGWEEGTYDRNKRDHRKIVPSELSEHVIFLGLDQEFGEADLTAFLATHQAYPTNVTIIRDRNTGLSKCFGFAQFPSSEVARAFVEPNFPFVYVPPKASQLAQGYSEENGRRVKIDFSQSAQPRGSAGGRMHNDGTRDIGNSQAPVVLLRGVDFAATVHEIADAIKACTGPKDDGLKGARKVMLARDRFSQASLGFAFVEYVNSNAASRLIGATMSPELHPSGFRIGSRAIAASFAHPTSFPPLENRPPDEHSLICTLAVGGSDTGWCAYWDQSAYVEVLEYQVNADTIAELTPATTEVEKKKEKKKDKSKHSAQKLVQSTGLIVLSEPKEGITPSAMPLLSKPLSLSLNKASGSSEKATAGVQRTGIVFDDHESPIGQELGPDPSKPKVTIWKANPMMQGKKVVGNINKWNNAQGELSRKKPDPSGQGSTAATSSSSVIIPPPRQAYAAPATITVAATAPLVEELPYGDPHAMTCLLCSRQFKGLDMLKKHSSESALHKSNLDKPELCEAAKAKLQTARQASSGTLTSTEENQQPKYRDRAAERRVALRQPDHPMPEQTDKKRKWAEGPPPPAPPPAPPVVPGKDENNVGNKLLKKMGWSEGAGLGTNGEGRVDPVHTALYEQGVGLGASKAKEVTNFQGYREMARESARERFGTDQ